MITFHSDTPIGQRHLTAGSRRSGINFRRRLGSAQFLFRDKGASAEYGAGLDRAIEKGWLKLHESGTFVTFTQAGTDLFA